MIDGEGSEEEEISGHRDMKRIKTNNIRGGMCLVLCEGLIQKSKKVLKYTNIMNLKEWDILDKIGNHKKEEKGDKGEKYLRDIIAGRPVLDIQTDLVVSGYDTADQGSPGWPPHP